MKKNPKGTNICTYEFINIMFVISRIICDDRAGLCAAVGVKDDEKSSALPLLSNIVAAYTERIKRKINKSKKEPC